MGLLIYFEKFACRYLILSVNWFEIRIDDKRQEDEFYKSLRQLVTMVFGIVFSIGLSELKLVKFWSYDFFFLVTAYYVILQSWWGYHYSTITNISEKNILNYVIDIFLIIQYYLLIIKRQSLSNDVERFIIIFCAYLLWELIRLFGSQTEFEKKARILNAVVLNLIFGMVIYLFKVVCDFNCNPKWGQG